MSLVFTGVWPIALQKFRRDVQRVNAREGDLHTVRAKVRGRVTSEEVSTFAVERGSVPLVDAGQVAIAARAHPHAAVELVAKEAAIRAIRVQAGRRGGRNKRRDVFGRRRQALPRSMVRLSVRDDLAVVRHTHATVAVPDRGVVRARADLNVLHHLVRVLVQLGQTRLLHATNGHRGDYIDRVARSPNRRVQRQQRDHLGA